MRTSRFCLRLRFLAHIYSVDVIHWSPLRSDPMCVFHFIFIHDSLSLSLLPCLLLASLIARARSHTPFVRRVCTLQSNKSPHTRTQTTILLIDWMAQMYRRTHQLFFVGTFVRTASAGELFQRWFCCVALQYHQISWRVWFAFLCLQFYIFGSSSRNEVFYQRKNIRGGKKFVIWICVKCYRKVWAISDY